MSLRSCTIWACSSHCFADSWTISLGMIMNWQPFVTRRSPSVLASTSSIHAGQANSTSGSLERGHFWQLKAFFQLIA